MRLVQASICLLALVIYAQPSGTESKNILMIGSLIGGSHHQMLTLIGTELAGKGHNITVLLGECTWNMTERAKYQGTFTFQSFSCGISEEESVEILDTFSRLTLSGELSSIVWYAKLWMGWIDDPNVKLLRDSMRIYNRAFLGDSRLMENLNASKYDLVICDVMTPMCSIAAHDILRVPYVNLANGGPLGTRYTRWMDVPSPLSYVPEYLTHFTDRMSFPQRVKNFLMHAFSMLIYDVATLRSFESIRAELGIMSDSSLREIFRSSSLFVLNWDFVLEYPRPLQPNVIFAGGVSTRPAQPLSAEFEEFVQGSGEAGVLVFSVSTLVNCMDAPMADMIASALARLPLRVVWKFKGDRKPATLGNNTLLASWLPQSDLLGHNKTKIFVFHGGINGAYEAVYYGVPVVGIPLFADQIDDLLRLHSLGMAEYVKEGIHVVTSELLYQMIMKVASNPSYKERAREASEIFKAQPERPLDRASFWIDHVLEHGAGHLRSRPAARELSWVQRTLLDVAVILGTLTLLLLLGFWMCVSALYRCVVKVQLPLLKSKKE